MRGGFAMTVAVAVLSLVCLVLACFLIKEKAGIRKIIKEIEKRSAGDSNVPLPLVVPDRDLEKLVVAMNKYVAVYQKKLGSYVNHESDFKHQISNISHDLRTPLTSIIGYVQLMKRNGSSEYLDIVEKKAQLLKALIGQFYDLSRLDGGEYELHMERIELKTFIAQVMADYYDDFEQAGFEVTVQLPDKPVYIMADSRGMMRICHNLLQNVLKHGRDRLVVTVRVVQDKKQPSVCLCFENDADVLSEAEVAHLFDRFYTADRMRTGQNTGLGLAIVRAMAEHMHQQISAVYADGRLKIRLTVKPA